MKTTSNSTHELKIRKEQREDNTSKNIKLNKIIHFTADDPTRNSTMVLGICTNNPVRIDTAHGYLLNLTVWVGKSTCEISAASRDIAPDRNTAAVRLTVCEIWSTASYRGLRQTAMLAGGVVFD